MLIKTITFIFENCEYIEIDGKYIGDFFVGGVHTQITRQAMNSIGVETISDIIKIEIHKDADKKYRPFGSLDEMTVFDRLCAYRDITQIKFTLHDQYAEPGKEVENDYHYFANWVGDSEWENEAQETYRSVPGNLYLTICKDQKLFDLFDKEVIDDVRQMNFVFEMYDIGGNADDSI